MPHNPITLPYLVNLVFIHFYKPEANLESCKADGMNQDRFPAPYSVGLKRKIFSQMNKNTDFSLIFFWGGVEKNK